MKKELKDYLYLYINCECLYTGEKSFMRSENVTHKLIGIEHHHTGVLLLNMRSDTGADCHYEVGKHKPILRKLSDMDAIERSKYEAKIKDGEWGTYFGADQCESPQAHVPFSMMAEITNCLRKDGFDCDGLIESGLAIDKTKL